MAKNKKNQPAQKLSPENYIRQNARKLPIHECWVNRDWEKSGTSSICVSRIHANGNVTFAMYLVDLYCMGVKESLYNFNESIDVFNKHLLKINENIEMIKIDYVLAHNIIYAAIEYADELGFKPHHSYTAITQYLLEEDTEDVELMDISCGCNGKPMFVKTEFMSNVESHRVIAQLNKSVGEGNYDLIIKTDNNGYDYEQDSDEDEDYDLINELDMLSSESRMQLFKELTCNGLDKVSDDDFLKLIRLTDSIFFMDLCDEEDVSNLRDKWSFDADVYIDEDLHTWESLGLESERVLTESELNDLDELDELMDSKPKKVEKKIESLRKKWGNIPYLDFMELKHLESVESKHYNSKYAELAPKLSGYSYFKIFSYMLSVESKIKNKEQLVVIDIDDVFDGRESITPKEMLLYFTAKLLALEVRNNKNELEAMYRIFEDVELPDSVLNMLRLFISMSRINFIYSGGK